ncbi:NADAR family protein [Kribbella yunnanensis]
MVRDRVELERLVAAGKRFRYVLFWGHEPERDGSLGPGCLSQWWPAPFVVDGVRYATTEHFMMAGKARTFGDEQTLAEILAVPSPAQAKALGRKVRNFDTAIWAEHRFDIVVAANAAKFSQYDDLRAYLLGTKDRVLVEASPVDRIWGIGLAADDVRAQEPRQWRGLNLLGFALMAVRRELAGDTPG